MLLLWMTACTPGTIETSLGRDELRTAWFMEQEAPDADRIRLLLLNSDLPCDVTPALEDPALREEALAQLYIAFTREGARAVYLELSRLHNEASWEGYFPLYDLDSVDHLLAGTHPRAARGLFVAVNEAIVSEEEGLYREYTPTEIEFGWADAPSQLQVRREGEQLVGSFGFNALDVSGRFRADACESLDFTLDQAELLITQLLTTPQED